MTALTANLGRKYQGEYRKSAFDVAANLEVFTGQCMCTSATGIVNSTSAAGDFCGFAVGHVDNRTNVLPGLGVARAVEVDLAIEGFVHLDVANGAAFTHDDVGLPVYTIDGNSFTTTATANSKVGVIVNCDDAVVSGGNTEQVLVYFNTALAHLLA